MLRLIGFVIAACSFISPAFSASTTLRLCIDAWPPYYVIIDGNGNFSGIDIDVSQEVAARMGLELVLEKLPYLRCQRDTLNGNQDGQFHVIADEAGLITGQHSVLPWVLTAFVRADAPYNTLRELKRQNGLVWLKDSDYEYPSLIETEFALSTVPIQVDHDIVAQPFRILLSEVADVYFEDYFWSMDLIQKHNLAIKPLTPVAASEEVFVGFNPAQKDKAGQWDLALGQLHEDGTIDAIVQKWTGRSYKDIMQDVVM